jgi:uncharacterized protein YecE (DUF72 family)
MWAHEAWQGRYLPERLGRVEQLRAYATWCNAVEGNTTFYGVPSPASTRRWADATPSTFRFLFKLPRTITHERRLRRCGAELAAFLGVLEPLGARASTLSVQLPASFGPDELAVLDRFLRDAPTDRRWAVEVRHPAFFDGGPAGTALASLLRERGAEWTSFDTTVLFSAPPTSAAELDGWEKKPRLPRRTVAIGTEPVVRYVGRDDPDATVAGWADWVGVVSSWLREGRRPTFFVHTPDNDEALGLARRFYDEVRAVVPELAPLPTPVDPSPGTLF